MTAQEACGKGQGLIPYSSPAHINYQLFRGDVLIGVGAASHLAGAIDRAQDVRNLLLRFESDSQLETPAGEFFVVTFEWNCKADEFQPVQTIQLQ